MSSFTTIIEAGVLNHLFRNVALPSPTAIYVGLFTAAPSDAGGGTEVTGNGYARLAMSFDAPDADPEDPDRQAVINTAAVTFTSAHEPKVSAVGFGVFDAETGGTLLTWGTWDPADLGVGAEIRIPVGGLKIALS